VECINEILRERTPGVLARVAMRPGRDLMPCWQPQERFQRRSPDRELSLGVYPLESQFRSALFETMQMRSFSQSNRTEYTFAPPPQRQYVFYPNEWTLGRR